MTAPTLYQHYKTLARLIEYQATPEAIAEQDAATRAATRAATMAGNRERFDRVAARLSARAIRVARRERAANV